MNTKKNTDAVTIKKVILSIAVCLTLISTLSLTSCAKAQKESAKYDNEHNYSGTLTADVDGIKMDYFSFGTGEKSIVILPGLTVTSEMRYAEEVIEQYDAYESEYTVYCFDRRKNMPKTYSIEDIAKDTVAVMKSIGLSDTYILGASQGGSIGIEMAINYPDMVHALCVCSTTVKATDLTKSKLNKAISFAKKKDIVGLNKYMNSIIYSKEYYKKYQIEFEAGWDFGSSEDMEHFITLATASLNYDATAILKKIKTPVFVEASVDDDFIEVENSNNIVRVLGCEKYYYSGYGHCVYDEAPNFPAKVLEFFNSTNKTAE